MAGIREEMLDGLIGRIYEAGLRPELWRAVLHEISLALGAAGATVMPARPDFPPVYSDGLDELAEAFFRGGWHLRNARAERAAVLKPQGIMTDQTLFTREELDHLPFNAELINPQGFRWFAGARLTTVGGCELNLDIDRLARDEPFGRRELEIIAKLLPHLRRAAETAYELGLARTEGMLDALEQMSCGAVLLNASGRVVRLNAHARQHIGRCLGLSDGRLSALSGRANDGLQRLIDSASRSDVAGQSDPEILALPRPGRRPLLVHAAPIVRSAQDVFRCARAILMFVEPDEPREPAEPVLRQAFGLTPVEAQIALGLARGQDLQEIATNRAVSVGTVRMQIKSIFQKTETHRQAELVALLNHFAQAPGSTSRGTEPLRSHAACAHARRGKNRG